MGVVFVVFALIGGNWYLVEGLFKDSQPQRPAVSKKVKKDPRCQRQKPPQWCVKAPRR